MRRRAEAPVTLVVASAWLRPHCSWLAAAKVVGSGSPEEPAVPATSSTSSPRAIATSRVAGIVVELPAEADEADLDDGSPYDCVRKGYEFRPQDQGRFALNAGRCQELCAARSDCEAFSFKTASQWCHFAAAGATPVRSTDPSLGVVAGRAFCAISEVSEQCEPSHPPGVQDWGGASPMIAEGRGEFPAATVAASHAGWPSGRQPRNLECWPRGFKGEYIPCKQVSVLMDTGDGWPGRCVGMVKQVGLDGPCGLGCTVNPLCASWANDTSGSCWHGPGYECYSEKNPKPLYAQRLQHGTVRVLRNLTGWQVAGLSPIFHRAFMSFASDVEAVRACRDTCYSDISCQYWTYSPRYGCWIEDTSRAWGPAYPLTRDGVFNNTPFAQDCVAGEMILHTCAEGATTSFPPYVELLPPCMVRGVLYIPLNMAGQDRTTETDAIACQVRCQQTPYCAHFSYYPDGGCHLQAGSATFNVVSDAGVVSGPPHCDPGDAYIDTHTGWLDQEADMLGPTLPPSWQGTPSASSASPPVVPVTRPAAKTGERVGDGGGGEGFAGDGLEYLHSIQGVVGAAAVAVGVGAVLIGICSARNQRRSRVRGYSRAPTRDEDDSSDVESDDDYADEVGGRDDIWAQAPAWNGGRKAAN